MTCIHASTNKGNNPWTLKNFKQGHKHLMIAKENKSSMCSKSSIAYKCIISPRSTFSKSKWSIK